MQCDLRLYLQVSVFRDTEIQVRQVLVLEKWKNLSCYEFFLLFSNIDIFSIQKIRKRHSTDFFLSFSKFWKINYLIRMMENSRTSSTSVWRWEEKSVRKDEVFCKEVSRPLNGILPLAIYHKLYIISYKRRPTWRRIVECNDAPFFPPFGRYNNLCPVVTRSIPSQ